MMRIRTAALCAVLTTTFAFASYAGAPATQQPAQAFDDRPNIEVTFVLDTTSSMSSLIEGAKEKVWSIASRIARGKPTPRLKVGLVAFRDIGDEYVTKKFDLTTDLDSVFLNLKKFQAQGGGDGPEHVGRGLGEAVSQMSWSQDKKTMKMIFLVGDAPPHDDYHDGWDSKLWAKKAIERGIVVNTIRCGEDATTERAWREIARIADGTFTTIGQGGGMVAMATPYDDKIAKLNAEIAAKTVYAGEAPARKEAKMRADAVAALPASVAADRMGYMATTSAGRGAPMAAAPAAIAGTRDITAAPAEVEKLADADLPEELRAMDKAQRKEHVAKLAEERKALEKQVLEASKQRDEWISKNAKEKADSFDAKVMENVKKQASSYGLTY